MSKNKQDTRVTQEETEGFADMNPSSIVVLGVVTFVAALVVSFGLHFASPLFSMEYRPAMADLAMWGVSGLIAMIAFAGYLFYLNWFRKTYY